MANDSESFRDKIRRYRALLEQHRDPGVRKALEDLIREAKAQLGEDPDKRPRP